MRYAFIRRIELTKKSIKIWVTKYLRSYIV